MPTEKIEIFDTTLRDGEQVPGCRLDVKSKLEIAMALENLGVDIIEAGFPVSSPGDFEAVSQISKRIRNAKICALSRAVESDIKIAAEALKLAASPRIHTGIGTSDYHIKHKFKSNRSDILNTVKRSVSFARNLAAEVEFYAEDAGRTDNVFLAEVCTEAIKAGATILNIPDTTGYCLPSEYGAKIAYLKTNVEGIEKATISVHCHNDLGLATANSLFGIANGARQLECTINGIGERAGNTSLEEVVMVLRQHESFGYTTNIETPLLFSTSQKVAQLMGLNVPPNKAIVGTNAFAHSSGIHQDGVLKSRDTYEIIDPKTVGAGESAIILTARSGRSALAFKANKIGYDLSKIELDHVYNCFLKVADTMKTVNDKDLAGIIQTNGIAPRL